MIKKLFKGKDKKNKKETVHDIQKDIDQMTKMLFVNGQQMTEQYRKHR